MAKIKMVACFAIGLVSLPVQAEFIGNAFGGRAEEVTRSAAQLAFIGLEIFYSGMSLLEKKATADARNVLLKSAATFDAASKQYATAADLLDQPIDWSRLDQIQSRVVDQYLSEFGAKVGSDARETMAAYARSYGQLARAIVESGPNMDLSKFRQLQFQIDRQIAIGIAISTVLRLK